MIRRADWLAWVIQGTFGMIAGAVLGLVVVVAQEDRGLMLDGALLLWWLSGAALIGAGLGSRYGDRLWIGDSYKILPPDEPKQNNVSDLLSWCLLVSGAATCGFVLFRQFKVF